MYCGPEGKCPSKDRLARGEGPSSQLWFRPHWRSMELSKPELVHSFWVSRKQPSRVDAGDSRLMGRHADRVRVPLWAQGLECVELLSVGL